MKKMFQAMIAVLLFFWAVLPPVSVMAAETVTGVVQDIQGPTRFTLHPDNATPNVTDFVVFNVSGIDHKTRSFIPGPTTLVYDNSGKLISSGTTTGIKAFDHVTVTGTLEADNFGLFALSVIDNSIKTTSPITVLPTPTPNPTTTVPPVPSAGSSSPLAVTAPGTTSKTPTYVISGVIILAIIFYIYRRRL